MSQSPSPVLLSDLGEDQVLTALLRRVQSPSHIMGAIGPGDDCAVIPVPGSTSDWLLTSDPVIAGIHFLPETDPRFIGRKAIGRAISDIAAMGGTPQWIIINITSPADLPLTTLERVYDGVNEMASAYDSTIMGGDIGRGLDFALHVFAIGQVPHGTAILRSGAAPGDILYVTGELGGSQLGHHLIFSPRVKEGHWLREQGWATAMMDISDGISTDARRLMQASQVGLDLQASRIPISAAARQMPDGLPPLQHALNDGEDFELLFTVRAEQAELFEKAWAEQFDLPCTPIGQVTDNVQRFRIIAPDGQPQDWQDQGYVHFSHGSDLSAHKSP